MKSIIIQLLIFTSLFGIVFSHFEFEAAGKGVRSALPIKAIAGDENGNIFVGGSNLAAGNATGKNILWYNKTGNEWKPIETGLVGTVESISYDSANHLLWIAGGLTLPGEGSFPIITYNPTNAAVSLGLPTPFASIYYIQYKTSVEVSGTRIDSVLLLGMFNGTSCIGYFATPNNTDIIGCTGAANERFESIFFDSDSNSIYVVGNFSSVRTDNGVEPVHSPYLVRWNGTRWEEVLGRPNGVIHAIHQAVQPADFCVGGLFSSAGTGNNTISANNVACYDLNANHWSSLGNGTNGEVFALFLAPESNTIYVGGSFSSANNFNYTNNIASYYNGTWSMLQLGVVQNFTTQTSIRSFSRMAVASDATQSLFIGGSFTSVLNRDGRVDSPNVVIYKTDSPVPAPIYGRRSSSGLTASNIILIVMVCVLFVLILCCCIIFRTHWAKSHFPPHREEGVGVAAVVV